MMKNFRFVLSVWDGTICRSPSEAIQNGLLYAFAESDKLDLDWFHSEMEAFKNDPKKWESNLDEESFPKDVKYMAFCITDIDPPSKGTQIGICWWNVSANKWDFYNT
jgi:hypothetical protein